MFIFLLSSDDGGIELEDAIKEAFALRMIDENMPDLPDSKINMAVENIYRIWLENKEDKLTQLVFLQ